MTGGHNHRQLLLTIVEIVHSTDAKIILYLCTINWQRPALVMVDVLEHMISGGCVDRWQFKEGANR